MACATTDKSPCREGRGTAPAPECCTPMAVLLAALTWPDALLLHAQPARAAEEEKPPAPRAAWERRAKWEGVLAAALHEPQRTLRRGASGAPGAAGAEALDHVAIGQEVLAAGVQRCGHAQGRGCGVLGLSRGRFCVLLRSCGLALAAEVASQQRLRERPGGSGDGTPEGRGQGIRLAWLLRVHRQPLRLLPRRLQLQKLQRWRLLLEWLPVPCGVQLRSLHRSKHLQLRSAG
mmetsp:Transcript_56124/g.180127  ORF Transcript_56124/g.180127 Transcript_56124/m.180127 type:complete len:233 (+) Transcript_56124:54-752(+)